MDPRAKIIKYINRGEEEGKEKRPTLQRGRPEDVLNEFKLILETSKKNKLRFCVPRILETSSEPYKFGKYLYGGLGSNSVFSYYGETTNRKVIVKVMRNNNFQECRDTASYFRADTPCGHVVAQRCITPGGGYKCAYASGPRTGQTIRHEILIMEPMETTVEAWLKEYPAADFKDGRRFVVQQVYETLLCLWNNDAVYTDLKPDNVMVNVNKQHYFRSDVKLIDLGSICRKGGVHQATFPPPASWSMNGGGGDGLNVSCSEITLIWEMAVFAISCFVLSSEEESPLGIIQELQNGSDLPKSLNICLVNNYFSGIRKIFITADVMPGLNLANLSKCFAPFEDLETDWRTSTTKPPFPFRSMFKFQDTAKRSPSGRSSTRFARPPKAVEVHMRDPPRESISYLPAWESEEWQAETSSLKKAPAYGAYTIQDRYPNWSKDFHEKGLILDESYLSNIFRYGLYPYYVHMILQKNKIFKRHFNLLVESDRNARGDTTYYPSSSPAKKQIYEHFVNDTMNFIETHYGIDLWELGVIFQRLKIVGEFLSKTYNQDAYLKVTFLQESVMNLIRVILETLIEKYYFLRGEDFWKCDEGTRLWSENFTELDFSVERLQMQKDHLDLNQPKKNAMYNFIQKYKHFLKSPFLSNDLNNDNFYKIFVKELRPELNKIMHIQP